MSINVVKKTDDLVQVNTVLISVSDKDGLEAFIPELLAIQPKLRILSTGGTYSRIQKILGEKAQAHLQPVSDYTGQPETQGGLVKTLDFKIYLGLLTETDNTAHQGDLKRTGAVPIDMVMVNLYPFERTVAQSGVTPEQARGNIDIGGPCMIRAAAKNFLRVASVTDPADYPMVLSHLRESQGATSLELRFRLAKKAFVHTSQYDLAIADYLTDRTLDEVRACYQMKGA